ncbi:MAG: FAD-dependent oxidoreductase [Caulobacteraceae bacterium]|nr:FAD-dependent oxidoreductase [Caulobacteraceae bacterium]
MSGRVVRTQCCIAGGGPAGMMAGYMLARAGIEVLVLEKHGDFLRDFRGDTVHPSTLQALAELGLLERFLQRPHTKIEQLCGRIGNETFKLVDFRHLPTRARFVAIMPQWEFLNFLAEEGAKLEKFGLMMKADVTGLVEDAGRVSGVAATTPDGALTIEADLVIAADGRRSILRERADLTVRDLGAPIDVLWMRLPRRPGDVNAPLGNIGAGAVFVMIEREDYYQCAFVVPKGGYDAVRAEGLEALKRRIVAVAPMTADRLDALASWDDIKLLSVSVDRLERWWKPGLLCIGDAAHAMSPIGGVGINMAIGDAVAAANILAAPLAAGQPGDEALARVQARRLGPVRAMQALQVLVQNRVLGPLLRSGAAPRPPLLVRLVDKVAWLRRIPARVVGLGFRLEHVRIPGLGG